VAVQFAILGPVEVTAGGQRLGIGGQRARAVLARLIVAANHVVGAEALAGELWPDLEAGKAAAVLQVRVAELRRAFRQAGMADRLVTRAPGYVLMAGPEEVDAARFDQFAAQGRALLAGGDAAGAAGCLEEALGLWRGPPLADVGDLAWARAEAVRLGEARLAAVECRIQARLGCGEAGELIAELEALTAEHRLRERLWALRMLALYRCGRQAEALAAYQQLRAILVEELGIEPATELRELHQQILAQDPAVTLATLGLATPVLVARPAVVPRELPADVTAFTGREVELAELDFLLPAAGQEPGATPAPVVISAVAGTAGVGKTTLAVRWAHRVAEQFPDGQLYVNLRGYDPGQPVMPSEALAGFLRALGVADADIPLEEAERAARYRSVVAGKRLLVVLDNVSTEDQVRPLLPGSASVMVVVTSRDSLPGLVAVDGARRLDLDLLPQGEAVALLGTLIGPRAGADRAAAEALAGLCARLPLALRVAAELAAARPGTPLAELVAELASERNRLKLLDAGGDPRGAVTSVFSWSYKHLPADAAQLFRLLGTHPGADWDQYAAAALTATTSLIRARQTLAELARAHLIQPAAPGRYQMHDLLRAYAASLATTGDSDETRQAALTRLFDYYLATCAAAADCLSPVDRTWRPDPPSTATPAPQLSDPAAAQAWLDAQLPTLVKVAEYTAGHGWPGHTGRLGATLHTYVNSTGHFIEGIIIGSYALDAARGSGDRAAQAAALRRLGNYHCHQGHLQQGADYLGQAVTLARDLGDRLAQAHGHFHLAVAQLFQGRYQHSARSFRQALALFRELEDQPGESEALSGLGQSYLWQGRYPQAASQLRQGLAVARQAGHRHGEAEALCNLGEACWWLGQYQQATDYAQEALTTSREIGYRVGEADALITLGRVRHRQGQHDQALAHQRQALALYQEIGDRQFQATTINDTGETLLATGQHTHARDCFATAFALAHRSGNPREQARALSGLGEVCHQQGHHDQAAGYHQQALALYQEIGDRGGQAEALNGAGETFLASGQPDQARACHAAALALTRRSGDYCQQARAHRGLAGACHAIGQQSQAQQHWQHALDIYDELGLPEADRMRTTPVPLDQAPSPVTPAGT
jgi:DNA-binding SARP family transcriptional activator/tetratricopeptide (TPR) repeat protein